MKQKTKTIASALTELLADLGMESNIKRYEVIDRWPEIAGQQVAAVSKAVRIENQILFVKVANSTWRNELLYLKEAILERISRDIGTGIVKEIRFI